RGTALMIYWLSRPEWFCQYQQETEIKPWEEENYKFIRFVEKMYPSISTEYIIYDPKDDKQIGLYTGDFAIKSTLPPIMYQTTRGQVYYKDIV
ncbi:MAG: hypothetical protein SFU27_00580, partial [Thermonemataceae bacterium]|nr:hypothetical protein [Thermonemataceae bacterium]